MDNWVQSAGWFAAWAVLLLGVLLVLAYRRASLAASTCVLGLVLAGYWVFGSAGSGGRSRFPFRTLCCCC